MESFLGASFDEYSQVFADRADPLRFHRAPEYSLPMTVAPHIYRVFQAIDIPAAMLTKRNRKRVHTLQSSMKLATNPHFGYVSPGFLNSYYSITSTTGSTDVEQTVYAAMSQTFSPSDLSAFQYDFGLPPQPVATNIGKLVFVYLTTAALVFEVCVVRRIHGGQRLCSQH